MKKCLFINEEDYNQVVELLNAQKIRSFEGDSLKCAITQKITQHVAMNSYVDNEGCNILWAENFDNFVNDAANAYFNEYKVFNEKVLNEILERLIKEYGFMRSDDYVPTDEQDMEMANSIIS